MGLSQTNPSACSKSPCKICYLSHMDPVIDYWKPPDITIFVFRFVFSQSWAKSRAWTSMTSLTEHTTKFYLAPNYIRIKSSTNMRNCTRLFEHECRYFESVCYGCVKEHTNKWIPDIDVNFAVAKIYSSYTWYNLRIKKELRLIGMPSISLVVSKD